MIVRYEYADVFTYACDHCDAAIVRGRRGLNTFTSTWTTIVGKLEARRLDGRALGHPAPEPWRDATLHSRTLTVDPPLGRLKVLYFIENQVDAEGHDDIFVTRTLNEALDRLEAARTIKSVAYTGVPPLPIPGETGMKRSDVLARVQLTADVARRWMASHPQSSIGEFVLVSNSENLRGWLGCTSGSLLADGRGEETCQQS